MNTNTTTDQARERRIADLETELARLRTDSRAVHDLMEIAEKCPPSPEVSRCLQSLRRSLELVERIRILKEQPAEAQPESFVEFWKSVQFAFLRHDLAAK